MSALRSRSERPSQSRIAEITCSTVSTPANRPSFRHADGIGRAILRVAADSRAVTMSMTATVNV